MPNPPEQSGAAPFEELSRVRLTLSDGLRAAVEQRFGVHLDGDATTVAGGDECAIWRVGSVVVRIAPTWRVDADLAWTHDLVRHVARTVPEALAPIVASDGTTFFRYESHPVSVFPFVEGEQLEHTTALVTAAGALLARVHRAIAGWTPGTLRRTIVERRERTPLPDDLNDIELHRWHRSLDRGGAPKAVIHGDFYRRNLLERDGRIVALLDWDEAHQDYLGQEIAWSMWEFAKTDGVRIDERLASAFLDGYVSAGGRLPTRFRTDAIDFIRWRLRDELHLQFSALAHGEMVDREYFETQMAAFTTLRGTELFPARFGPSESNAGREWIAEVPALVRASCARWGLEETDDEPRTGAHAIVVPVRRGDEPCVLKLSMDGDTDVEARALATWDGRGAVKLLGADQASGTLLLERLRPETLHAVPLPRAAEIAGQLLRRLAVHAGGFTHQSDLLDAFSRSMNDRARRLGDPIPAPMLDVARKLSDELARSSADRLVHSDLHYANVHGGEREPWLAIDPRPVIGDPELEVPELLWSRHDEVDGPAGLPRLLDVIVRSGDLDAERARSWVVVRCVEYWIWGLEHGLTEDPIRCRRILDVLA